MAGSPSDLPSRILEDQDCVPDVASNAPRYHYFPMLWMGLVRARNRREGNTGSWGKLLRTITREVAQVQASGGYFSRHVGRLGPFNQAAHSVKT